MEDLVGAWQAFQGAWREGGLAFVLFIGIILFFTGRIASGRELSRTIEDWKARYEENDRRWQQRYDELRARADNNERMLYQVMGWGARVTAVAERVADKVIPVPSGPSPPGSLGGP